MLTPLNSHSANPPLTPAVYYVKIPRSQIYSPHGQIKLMKLAVVILNWNAAHDTIRCVQDIFSWKHLQPKIWVVDNGSVNGSVELIAHECPDACLIRSEVNLGFAGGNNRGIVGALAAGDAPILLLNNDASIAEENVVRLLETLQANQQIGFVGPLLFDADREDRLLSAGGRDPLHHHTHIYDPLDDGLIRVVDYVPGTVILGRADVFRKVGLLDEDYFFTMEVADLCIRARRHGYLSAIDARSHAFHDLGRSSELRETLHTYYIIRNRFLFIRKFHHKRRFWLYGFWGLYSLALALKVWMERNPDAARAMWMGLVDGLRGRFGGQNERVLAACSGASTR